MANRHELDQRVRDLEEQVKELERLVERLQDEIADLIRARYYE